MITSEQKVEMFKMRLEGKSYDYIGRQYGISKQGVSQILLWAICGTAKILKGCVYPAISEWCQTNNKPIHQLAIECGLDSHTFYLKLRGKSNFKQDEIEKVLSITGLPYEEAFKKEEKSCE
jgi:hypothetical protein